MNQGTRLNTLSTDKSQTLLLSDLRLNPYEVETILDVKIKQQINEHATLYCRALLTESTGFKYIGQNAEGTNISLTTANQSDQEPILFQGLVKEIEVNSIEGSYYLEVQAVSYSSLLDVKEKSRSFQDKTMTYTQLAEAIVADYTGADIRDVISNGKPINQFLVQYLETDWELLKRLASNFNTGIVCNPRFDSPKIYFGVPQNQSTVLDCFNYSVKKDFQKFKQLSENGVNQLSEHDFIYFHVETPSVLNIGDLVQFQDKQLRVSAFTRLNRQEMFLNQYTLLPTKGLSQLECFHHQIVGCSFNGRVIDIKNDRVKVHLDIDETQNVQTASYLPYSTIYSSPDGSGWYCMPKLGDQVRVYFPDDNDDHAYAISSVHDPITN